MTGKYDIEVYNNKVHYFLTVKRNITVIQGNSATGKTELIRLIQEHEENGISSGISLLCSVKCTVLTSVDWELRLRSLSGRIIFIDESASFTASKRFAELVRGSDNYFVIVTRDDLSQLPYSIEEIYGLRNTSDSQKYKSFKKVYNEMYHLYDFRQGVKALPEIVITEDSNSGFEFFGIMYPGICVSAHGKSRIYTELRKHPQEAILAIVDGAAFGSEIGKIYRYLLSGKHKCVLYAPESFEYLILSAGILEIPREVIHETWLLADSREYMSWEEYYTKFLITISGGTIYQYSKTKLVEAYRTEGSVKRIRAAMPDEVISF